MKAVKKTGLNGKTVTILEPENAADAKKLAMMVATGKADGRVSHGDMREDKQVQKSRSGKSWSDHLVDYHREKYGDMTTRVRLVVHKAKPHGAASARPPKGWWDETYARVKKENPKLEDERIRKIVGSMWYQTMSHPARKKERRAEGKKYKKVAKSHLVLRTED